MSDNHALEKDLARTRSSKRGRLTIDERVEDGHGTVGDTSVGVDLLQDCVIVRHGPRNHVCGARSR